MLAYCQWKKLWWAEQASARQLCSSELPDGVKGPQGPALSRELAEGLSAFAAEQGDMEDCIGATWAIKWAGARELAWPIIATVMGNDAAPSVLAVDAILDSIVDLDLRDDEDGTEGPNFRLD